MIWETPATGAADLSAARIPPGLGFVQARRDLTSSISQHSSLRSTNATGFGEAQSEPKTKPKSRKKRWNTQSCFPMAVKTALLGTPNRFYTIFGLPPASKNSPKISSNPKRSPHKQYSYRFLLRTHVFPPFSSIFVWFFMKFPLKSNVFVHNCSCFFFTWRPSRNIVFYISKGTSSFFALYIFLEKNIKN